MAAVMCVAGSRADNKEWSRYRTHGPSRQAVEGPCAVNGIIRRQDRVPTSILSAQDELTSQLKEEEINGYQYSNKRLIT